MDDAQNYFALQEFHKFRHTLAGYVEYWSEADRALKSKQRCCANCANYTHGHCDLDGKKREGGDTCDSFRK
jgi:hypothetical protein